MNYCGTVLRAGPGPLQTPSLVLLAPHKSSRRQLCGEERAWDQTPTSRVLIQCFNHSTTLGKLTSNFQFWGAHFLLKPIHLTRASAHPIPQQLPSTAGIAKPWSDPAGFPFQLWRSTSCRAAREPFLAQKHSPTAEKEQSNPSEEVPPPSCGFQEHPGAGTHGAHVPPSPSRCPLARGIGAGVRRGSGDREQAVYRETIQPCLQSRFASARRSPRDAWRRSRGRVGDRNILCSSSQAGPIR